MSRLFSEELLNSCKISKEDWVKPLPNSGKESTYLIGSFNQGYW